MKKISSIIFLFAILLSQSGAIASDPLKIILSGSFNANYNKDKSANDESFEGSFLPQFGLLFNERIESGFGIGFSFSNGSYQEIFSPTNNTNSYTYSNKSKSNTTYVNLYVRDYCFRKEKLKVFYGVSFNRYKGNTEYTYEDYYNSSNQETFSFDRKGFSAGINAGLNYRLSDKIEFSSSFGVFNYSKSTYEGDGFEPHTEEDIGLAINFESIYLGIRFIL